MTAGGGSDIPTGAANFGGESVALELCNGFVQARGFYRETGDGLVIIVSGCLQGFLAQLQQLLLEFFQLRGFGIGFHVYFISTAVTLSHLRRNKIECLLDLP